jgi:biotin-(acetyl-CoA carboxylase) ligase
MDIYTGYSATIGNRIRVRSQEGSIEGIACGFNMEGGLLLKRDSGVIDTILTGDIEHISKE